LCDNLVVCYGRLAATDVLQPVTDNYQQRAKRSSRTLEEAAFAPRKLDDQCLLCERTLEIPEALLLDELPDRVDAVHIALRLLRTIIALALIYIAMIARVVRLVNSLMKISIWM
jgi:hypothetical protein